MSTRKNRLRWFTTVLLVCTFMISLPFTAMAEGTESINPKIFLSIDGIKGASTFEGEEASIEVTNFQFAVSKSISMDVGNLANREASRPSFNEITFTKPLDASTIGILKEAIAGAVGFEAEFHFYRDFEIAPQLYYTIRLEDALFSSYMQVDGMEQIQLSYTRINFEYYDNDKSVKSAVSNFGFDLRTGTPN